MLAAIRLARRILRALPPLERLRTRVRTSARTEDVHDLRILTRRLRAALRAACLFLRRPPIVQAREELRTLGRALGSVRALDVALEDLGRHRERPIIEARRRRALAALRRNQGAPEPHLRNVALRLGRAGLRPRRASRLLKWGIRDEVPRTKRGLHRLRIEVKKCRYLLETLQAMGLCRRPPLEALQEVQRELGRAHDYETLRSYLKNSPRTLSQREARHALRGRRLAPLAAVRANAALAGVVRRLDE